MQDAVRLVQLDLAMGSFRLRFLTLLSISIGTCVMGASEQYYATIENTHIMLRTLDVRRLFGVPAVFGIQLILGHNMALA